MINRIVLKTEKEINKEKRFLSVNEFKNSEVIIPDYMLSTHSMIKGGRRSGKTDKILIPTFTKCKSGVLYIDYNNETENTLKDICQENNRTLHKFYNKDVNIQNVINSLLDGHIVYFNIRPSKENDIEHLNLIIKGLNENRTRFNSDLTVFIDNIQFLGKLDGFENLILDKSKINLIFTLSYSRQLTSFYSEDFVKKLKDICNCFDVEKQQY